MDWIKIKRQHISPSYTVAQIGTLVKFQLLVAMLERTPSREEVYKEIPSRYVVSLEQALSRYGVDLEYVTSKVLEDAEQIQSRRELGKDRQRKHRAEKGMSHVTVTPSHEADKIREDKIRLDKTVYGDSKNILLTIKEKETLIELIGEDNLDTLIEELSDYIASTGKQYKSHYATIRSWARRKSKETITNRKGKGLIV